MNAGGETPAWLVDYAIRTGQDPVLIGTRAVPKHCRMCGLSVLTGYDAPACATLAVADPYRATWQQEAAAVILARPTYRLWGDPGRYELHWRHFPGVLTPWVNRPATDVVVLIAHRCGLPRLATQPVPTYPRRTAAQAGPPPF